jgi:hypothetical protein
VRESGSNSAAVMARTESPCPRPALAPLKPLTSDFHPEVVHPAGSEVVLVEPLDAARKVWLVEIRVPDETLVGGASFDVAKAELSELRADVSEAALADEIESAQGEPDQDRLAARTANARDVPVERGATRAPRQPVHADPG